MQRHSLMLLRAVSNNDSWAIPSRAIPGKRYRLPDVCSWPVTETGEVNEVG